MRFFEGTRAPLLMYRRTTALAGALSVLVLGSPLMTGCSDSAGNIHFTSAGLKYARGNYQGAIADYNKAIEINPQYANAYSNRGITKAIGFNDKQGACSDFKKAASLGHEYRITWLNSEGGAWCRNMR